MRAIISQLRNAARAAESVPANAKPQDQTPAPAAGLGGSRFSTEDLANLYRLEVAYAGDLRIASKIQRVGEMPGFTAKQIRDKRKKPAYQRCLDEHLAARRATMTSDSSSASSDDGGASPPPTPDSTARTHERPDTPHSVGEIPAGSDRSNTSTLGDELEGSNRPW